MKPRWVSAPVERVGRVPHRDDPGAVPKGFGPKIFSHLTPKNEEESDLLPPLCGVKWAHFGDVVGMVELLRTQRPL